MSRVIAKGVNGDATWTVESVSGFDRIPYYKKINGVWKEIVLPGDPYHMKRYLRRGFMLEQPPMVEEKPTVLNPIPSEHSKRIPDKKSMTNMEKSQQLSFF